MKSCLLGLLLCLVGLHGIAGGFHPSKRILLPNKVALRLEFSVIDLPQNLSHGGHFPSMRQSLQLANNFYELGYWGIDNLGNAIFPLKNNPKRKILNEGFKYALSLPFVRWGSDLPIPLGTWAHEEFHRSVLGLQGLKTYNGNWLLRTWNGTVFGTTDAELRDLKVTAPAELLRSYTSGIEAQNAISRSLLIQDFFGKRTLQKHALYLYDAWYVWHYFSVSCSPVSDSVKSFAPDFLSPDQRKRDFAGLDLTAWAYDMTQPQKDYLDRDSLPGLSGVNRYVGFSDLPEGAQKFLKRQRNLSLINFLQPAIFFKSRFRFRENHSIGFFAQYAPTPFGNAISLTVPYATFKRNYIASLYAYNNAHHYPGLEIGVYRWPTWLSNRKLWLTASVQGWLQPENQDFYADKASFGGAISARGDYALSRDFSVFLGINGKTKGWQLGNPYLGNNLSVDAGIAFQVSVVRGRF